MHRPEDFFLKIRNGMQFALSDYVYIVQAGEDGPVKIGMAVDPVLRFRELQSANWQELTMPAIVPVFGNRLKLEREAHRVATPYRIRGEWFDLTPVEAVSAVIRAASNIGMDIAPFELAQQRAKEERGARYRMQFAQEEEDRRAAMRRRLGMD